MYGIHVFIFYCRKHSGTIMSILSDVIRLRGQMDKYCSWPSVYPDIEKLNLLLRDVPTDQRLKVLSEKFSEWTPVWWAAERDHTDIIRTLLTSVQQSDRLQLLTKHLYTPLHTAACNGNTLSVLEIYSCLTPYQQLQITLSRDGLGTAALHQAASGGHTKSVYAILDTLNPQQQGELLSMRDKYGASAIDKASEKGHAETVRVLKQYLRITDASTAGI